MPFEVVPAVSRPLAADGTADGYAYVTQPAGLYPGQTGWLSDDSSTQRVLLTDLAQDSDGRIKAGLRFLAEENLTRDDPAVRSGAVQAYQSAGRTPLTAWLIANHARVSFPLQLVETRLVAFPELRTQVADPSIALFSATAIATGNSYTSKGLRIAKNTGVSFNASWTGTPTGTWSFETSNDSTNGVNGIWVPLTLPAAFSAGNPAGSAGSFDFEFTQMPEGWIRSKLAVTGSSGVLTETAEIK